MNLLHRYYLTADGLKEQLILIAPSHLGATRPNLSLADSYSPFFCFSWLKGLYEHMNIAPCLVFERTTASCKRFCIF